MVLCCNNQVNSMQTVTDINPNKTIQRRTSVQTNSYIQLPLLARTTLDPIPDPPRRAAMIDKQKINKITTHRKRRRRNLSFVHEIGEQQPRTSSRLAPPYSASASAPNQHTAKKGRTRCYDSSGSIFSSLLPMARLPESQSCGRASLIYLGGPRDGEAVGWIWTLVGVWGETGTFRVVGLERCRKG